MTLTATLFAIGGLVALAGVAIAAYAIEEGRRQRRIYGRRRRVSFRGFIRKNDP